MVFNDNMSTNFQLCQQKPTDDDDIKFDGDVSNINKDGIMIITLIIVHIIVILCFLDHNFLKIETG